MRKNRTRWVTTGVAAAATLSLAACSAGGSAAGPVADGPVPIEIWGWDPDTGEQTVEAFNEAQDEVEATYVLQADNIATQTNFRNAFEAGEELPCLVEGFGPLTTAVVNGWAQDITDAVTPLEDVFSEGALASATVDGRYYGVPTGSDGQFLIYNERTFEAAGVSVPTTWEEFVDVGRQLRAEGVDMTNLAGEDPTTLINLSQMAGAEWFTIDGDRWIVNFLGEETLQAADIIQQLIDDDLVSNQTYQDRPALYAHFDSGDMASTPTQWWSLTGLRTNLTESAGDWVATTIPQFEGADEPVAPGRTEPWFVPVGCENPDAVMAYMAWTASPDGIEAGRNPQTGAVNFPTQIADPAPYVEDIIPEGFFVDDEEAGDVIVETQSRVIGKFELGPNYDAWFPEMQDQWGKAVAGEITVEEALQAVQDFVAADLDAKGIDHTVG
ncbi:ABC transporter substrate-binding protein [Promicromonospora sp. MS192]|jgi:multiple sugar transport system substrate-binding protein|uniref:ABC transporter substrate-binding protein n=1 Tax=Promicromonospora sp. MS192 TaxID=3412684 RepID=UPI003C2F7757